MTSGCKTPKITKSPIKNINDPSALHCKSSYICGRGIFEWVCGGVITSHVSFSWGNWQHFHFCVKYPFKCEELNLKKKKKKEFYISHFRIDIVGFFRLEIGHILYNQALLWVLALIISRVILASFTENCEKLFFL